MANKVLTIVYEEAKQVIDSAIAAVVNELHDLGHTIKEVRVMGDTGEQKIALNTVEGVTPEAAGNAPVAEETPAPPPVESNIPAPPVAETPADVPVDTPAEPPVAESPVDPTTPTTPAAS